MQIRLQFFIFLLIKKRFVLAIKITNTFSFKFDNIANGDLISVPDEGIAVGSVVDEIERRLVGKVVSLRFLYMC